MFKLHPIHQHTIGVNTNVGPVTFAGLVPLYLQGISPPLGVGHEFTGKNSPAGVDEKELHLCVGLSSFHVHRDGVVFAFFNGNALADKANARPHAQGAAAVHARAGFDAARLGGDLFDANLCILRCERIECPAVPTQLKIRIRQHVPRWLRQPV
jgi:hypothetical protein